MKLQTINTYFINETHRIETTLNYKRLQEYVKADETLGELRIVRLQNSIIKDGHYFRVI